jgi:nucleoside-diphosphate-sugar epimerase
VAPVDAVLHLATWPGGAAEREGARGWAVNVDAAHALAAAALAADCRRFVFASSIAVYGEPLPALVDDSTPLAPTLLYGAHKAMIEIWLDTLTRRGDLHALSLRLPGIVARPRGSTALRSAFLSDLFHALAVGEPITLPVSREATAALQSVQCVAANLASAIECDASGAMNLPAQVLRVGELVDAVARATGVSASLAAWNPDPVIEAQFGRVPPLHAARAAALGFRADEGPDGLIATVLAGLT